MLKVFKDFTSLKARIEKLDINIYVNIPTGLNNLQTEVN